MRPHPIAPVAEAPAPAARPPLRPSARRTIAAFAAASAVVAATGGGCAPTLLERAARAPGATRLGSGAIFRSVTPGDGATPQPSDKVTVAWEGRFPDGSVFASSKDEGAPTEVPLEQASPCWRDALARMRVGEKAHVVCAPEIARGEAGPSVPAETTLSWDLELVGIGGAGAEVRLPPGLVVHTVREGTGEHPRGSDHVKVHYEGRLADGTVFDSSIARGEPAEFPLSGVIPCWRYGLQKMRVGEKAQLTCPPDLAYGAKGSPPNIPPNATLTFDVELLSVER